MKQILMTSIGRETKVALLENGRLMEIFMEKPGGKRNVGNVYKGKVVNVLPGMQAAFVQIGLERNAFLYIEDALPPKDEEDSQSKPSVNIKDVLKEGQELIVQVTKEPIGTKGARVTTHLTLPGRYCVFMPGADYIGVSRRIEDEEERERLRLIGEKIRKPGEGVILRTVAEGMSEAELEQDYIWIKSVWQQALSSSGSSTLPYMIYQDVDLIPRIIRDMVTDDVDEIIIELKRDYTRVKELLAYMAPPVAERVKLHQGQEPLFDAFHIRPEIDRALKKKVWLKSGGYIIIDQTEALTVIDVNTGKYTGSENLEKTVYKTNLEAVEEIARQLRLRDIGGIIVIDLIDMEEEANQTHVISHLEDILKRDRTKTHILGITRLGLLEMTRKKVRLSLEEAVLKPCHHCEGRGAVLSDEATAVLIEDKLRSELHSAKTEAILIELHPQVAAVFNGTNGMERDRLEKELNAMIYLKGNAKMQQNDFHIQYFSNEDEAKRLALPVKEGDIVHCKIEKSHEYHAEAGIARLEGYIIEVHGAAKHVGKELWIRIDSVKRNYASGSPVTWSVVT